MNTPKTLTAVAFAASLVACAPSDAEPETPTERAPAEAAEAAPAEGSAPEPSAMQHDEHAGHDHAAHDESPAEGSPDPGDIVSQPGASEGDVVRCPVTGQTFTVTGDRPHLEHGGGRVYFADAQSLRRFQREPDAFELDSAVPAGAGLVEVTAEGVEFDPPVATERIPEGAWYCDMGTVHYARSVEGDGRCPRCGMNLAQ